MAGEVDVAGSFAPIVSVNPDATPEEKIEFLLRQDQERQRDVNELRERVQMLERESSKRLAELGSRMERYVVEALAEAASSYRPVRVIGSIALAIGLGLTSAGNFVQSG